MFLCERLQETRPGATITFTVDLQAGLSQVLSDGAHTYLYGNGRIVQQDAAGRSYFLGDALGSVRQVVNAQGVVTLARSYAPYGEARTSEGEGSSSYGFTGEWQEASRVYLRARWYSPGSGRFLTRDVWEGDDRDPQSLNRWNYSGENPINRLDRSGMCYTDSNVFSSGFWSRFLEPPIMGPCTSDPGQTNDPPTSTPPPPAVYTTRCPTVNVPMPTPTPELEYLGAWSISYYVIALEADPAFPSNDRVPVSGLDPSKKYRRQFIYDQNKGIPYQGTGLSENGEYITMDVMKNMREYGPNWRESTNVALWYFTYAMGGATGKLIPWETVAKYENQGVLPFGSKVKIDGYQQTFEVTDTGTFMNKNDSIKVETHLDIFIGAKPIAEARRLGVRTNVDVWRVIE